MVNLDSIRRNSRGFSFIDRLGSFINNYDFSRGYEQFKADGGNTKDSYVWSAVSAIGGKYAEIIYENVLNYLDNVANVDLCKVSGLQSMIKILGIDYNIINDIGHMPVEVVDMVDVLSINKKYLMDNDTFVSSFYDELVQQKCVLSSTYQSSLSDDIADGGKILADDGCVQTQHLSNYVEISTYLNSDNYYAFLINAYKELLDRHIYMKYADAENGLSCKYEYIYQNIADRLIQQNTTSKAENDKYEQTIKELKIKYRLQNFKSAEVVDDIENGYDFITNYNQYEQEILSAEISRRNNTYLQMQKLDGGAGKPGSIHPYDRYSRSLGYSVTRYSYYREQKVAEYFQFVQNTYNSLINSSVNDVYSILNDSSPTTRISVYCKDQEYFDIDQQNVEYLLGYNQVDKRYELKNSYIYAVAEMLARQTLEISEIRDQLKIQLRKTYLKGTFLLLSYIINEYLKYNISKNFGDLLYDNDDVSLRQYINDSISAGNNVKLVEYYDSTNYYNVSAASDLCAVNEFYAQNDLTSELSDCSMYQKDKLNRRFWDDLETKIGEKTNDIPLDQINDFYVEQLKLKLNGVNTSSDLVNFLSVLYEYGANNTFLTGPYQNDFVAQVKGEDLSSSVWLGDIDQTSAFIVEKIRIIDEMTEKIDYWVGRGYSLSAVCLSDQLDGLSSYVRDCVFSDISSGNEDVRNNVIENIKSYKDTTDGARDEAFGISSELTAISSENAAYRMYLSGYTNMHSYGRMHDLISNFVVSLSGPEPGQQYGINGICCHNENLLNAIHTCSRDYDSLNGYLHNLIYNYVKADEYWPNYSTDSRLELTAQTKNLANYLQSSVAAIENAKEQKMLAHFQTHLDKLLVYCESTKEDLAVFNQMSALFEFFKNNIRTNTGTDFDELCSITYDHWTGKVNPVKRVVTVSETTGSSGSSTKKEEKTFNYYEYETVTSTARPVKGTISEQLLLLQERCALEFGDPEVTHIWEIATATTTETAGEKWTSTKKYYYNCEGSYNVLSPQDLQPDPLHINVKLAKTASTGKGDRWNVYWSAETAATIRSTLSNLVDSFKKTISFVNTELSCLDGEAELIPYTLSVISIPTKDATIDNIGVKLSSFYAQVIDRVQTLDQQYIKLGIPVSSDAFYKYYNSLINKKLDRAAWILSSQPDQRGPDEETKQSVVYNIKKIDSEFDGIETRFNAAKETNSEYLQTYSDYNYSTLNVAFRKLSSWIVDFDLKNQTQLIQRGVGLSLDYVMLFNQYKADTMFMVSSEVTDIGGDRRYVVSESRIGFTADDYIEDYIIQLNYIFDNELLQKFDQSARRQIALFVPTTYEYIDICVTTGRLRVMFKDRLETEELVTDLLANSRKRQNSRLLFIESRRDSYEAQKEIYLKYSGLDIGYDPFYAHSNKTHASYQIHPYLYNFIKASNAVYPLANTFYVSFTEKYEEELVRAGLDNIIGKYGNVINLWKYGMFDWTGYQSQYEYRSNGADLKAIPDSYGFDGLFHPDALRRFLDSPATFKQTVQDNRKDSPYYKLNLTQQELNKIVKQLEIYESSIREVAQRIAGDPLRSRRKEYDIYKYACDANGNSLILLKTYRHIRPEDPWYEPSYNEKKDTPGEMWMRVKNHPIAFPMFDLRESSVGYTQYEVDHEYVADIDKYFSNSKFVDPDEPSDNPITYDSNNVYSITLDSISKHDSAKHHMRCFVDMELSPDLESILLAVPYKTGTNHISLQGRLDKKTLNYANTNVVVGVISQRFNSVSMLYEYYFKQYSNSSNVESVTNNIDNITTPLDLVRPAVQATEKYDFVGFAKNASYIFAVFAHKYYYNAGRPVNQFRKPRAVAGNAQLQVLYFAYNGMTLISRPALKVPLKYDIRYENDDDYRYANRIVMSYSDERIDISYVSEEFQSVVKTPRGGATYSDDTKIVNYAEYTSMVEKNNALCAYGMNLKYPSDTALLQTDDAKHINIYNSFDSFTSYIVSLEFWLSKSSITHHKTRYYNINADIGYLPLFADKHGMSRIYADGTLSARDRLSFQLLGPENSDVAYTPVLDNQSINEANGRVTEDWSDYNRFVSYTPEMVLSAGTACAVHVFELSSIFVDINGQSTYNDLAETGQLLKYKWLLTNMSYTALPVAKGVLNAPKPTEYHYQSAERYEMISGQDIIGPNGVTYQNIPASNHVDNISAIAVEVVYSDSTSLPEYVSVSCVARDVFDEDRIIPESKFQLMLYLKNSLASYDFYRIIENANKELCANESTRMSRPEENLITMADISALSSYETDDGKKPFANTVVPYKIPSDMKAPLEFKYSEEDPIDREFPYIDMNADDDIIILNNEQQFIYFYSLDSFDTIGKDVFYMEKYDPVDRVYKNVKINTASKKYKAFYDQASVIETTYNVEVINGNEARPEYGIVQYFNYKNYTSPSYIKFKKRVNLDGTADVPQVSYCSSNDAEIKNTYLRLLPGQSGRLDIRFDYVEYSKLYAKDIAYSIVGKASRTVRTYYIMNVSDEKPKFIISKNPFS